MICHYLVRYVSSTNMYISNFWWVNKYIFIIIQQLMNIRNELNLNFLNVNLISEISFAGCFVNSGVPGLSIHKYRSLLNKDNTPFSTSSAAGPVRRLWNYLVRQDEAQDVFIKTIFGRKMDVSYKNFPQTHDGVDNGNIKIFKCG